MNWYDPLNKNNSESKRNVRNAGIIAICVIIAVALFYIVCSSGISDSQNSSESDSLPEDYKDFFSDYYTEIETSKTDINIPKYESDTEYTLCFSEKTDEQLSLNDIYTKCSVSIVGIKAYKDSDTESFSWGTGVVVSENGLILTNTHIIDTAVKVDVILFNDDSYEAKLVGADSISDISLLRIDCSGLIPAEFGDSSLIAVGDSVVAIGNPLGDKFSLTMTDGIISAIDRDINYNGHSMSLIQTNAALNEGNSGGALMNLYGQVIGITNMKMMSSYSSIEGIGFAIPSSTCKTVTDSLASIGQVKGRTSIGIVVGEIPAKAKSNYNLPDGLYITSVSENSDAYAKGIRVGDIITGVNGELCNTTSEVSDIKDKLKVGDELNLSIYRDGDTFDIDIVLMDMTDIYG